MKTKSIIISVLVIGLSWCKAQQLSDGKHVFTNEKGMTCTISTFENGTQVAVNLNLGKEYSGKVIKAKGEWMRVNMNGVEPGYKGPEGWYQVSDGNCSMEFESPQEQLKINLNDCKENELKDLELKFTKQK
jgi:hypothetical protein